ncbi:hypothetical protein LCGC14_0808550 [marine sediment metagenome]|uniref:Uncharacterized protein n=1 Tax=marine sediment metagenome TaxID=412755 RepID=A0A0F9SV06_9ZZZZ
MIDEGKPWVSSSGKYSGRIMGVPPRVTILLDTTAKARLARENVLRMQRNDVK